MSRPNQEIFAETVLALARENRDVLVVASDSRGSGKLVPFGQALPAQMVEVGIAEQTLVGVAAGLASAGKTVFAVSPACFLTARALEQIKNDVCYSDHPVTLVGISAGVSYGALGSTHHSIHDFAVLRAVPNIDIIAPADAFETREAVRAAAASTRPTYLRFGKFPVPDLHGPNPPAFEPGKAFALREGTDIAFLATGEAVWRAVAAADALAQDPGVSARVVSVPTVRPLDAAAVADAARTCGALVTVEEHSVHGGLGEACAAVLLEGGLAPKFRIVGIPDEDTVTGSQDEIMSHYRMSPDGLAAIAIELLGLT